MTTCPPLTGPDNNTDIAVVVELKQVYDQYGQCAGKHWELINYMQTLWGKNDN